LVKIKIKLINLENFDDNVDMNKAWENIRENIKSQPKRV
jgi:septin family protein